MQAMNLLDPKGCIKYGHSSLHRREILRKPLV